MTHRSVPFELQTRPLYQGCSLSHNCGESCGTQNKAGVTGVQVDNRQVCGSHIPDTRKFGLLLGYDIVRFGDSCLLYPTLRSGYVPVHRCFSTSGAFLRSTTSTVHVCRNTHWLLRPHLNSSKYAPAHRKISSLLLPLRHLVRRLPEGQPWYESVPLSLLSACIYF